MKTSKSLKINKLTKSEYHADVCPAFVAYRKEMHKACGVHSYDYFRLFTEKRRRGVRTKYWFSKASLPDNKISLYIARNPHFTVNGRTYEVTGGWVDSNPYYGFPNYAIFCNAIN